MVDNVFEVDHNKWNRMSEHAQRVFNSTYADITQVGIDMFLHPDTINRGISEEEFNTIAWNAAFIASDHVDHENLRTEVVELHDG